MTRHKSIVIRYNGDIGFFCCDFDPRKCDESTAKFVVTLTVLLANYDVTSGQRKLRGNSMKLEKSRINTQFYTKRTP